MKDVTYVTITSHKKKWVAFWLCLFLGELGAHYFYVGRIGMGILYLLTCGLFCIGWIVDIFRILAGKFRDSDGLRLKA
jgi:restriction system protein